MRFESSLVFHLEFLLKYQESTPELGNQPTGGKMAGKR